MERRQKINDWLWLDYDEIDSTNNAALKLSQTLPAGTKAVITAVRQTAGRGRRGRNWKSMEGNLFMSLIDEADMKDLGKMVFMSALCLLQTIKKLAPDGRADVKLKWPNDVLLNGGKVSGILFEKGAGRFFVVGIGVNIVAVPPPEGMLYPVSCLKNAEILTNRTIFLKNYLEIWNKTRDTWRQKGFEPIREMWLENVKGLNEEISVINENSAKKGIFTGVDEDGALLLKTADEKLFKVRAGDVFYMKKDDG